MGHAELTPAAAAHGQPPGDVRTLPELLRWRVATTPQREAYREFDGAAGTWRGITWAEAGWMIERWTAALSATGLPRAARVAILLPNGMHAVCADQAALALGHVPVPMHAIDNAASIAYVLGDSGASVLFAATLDQWQAIASSGVALPQLRRVVIVQQHDARPPQDGAASAATLGDWLAAAPATAAGMGDPGRPAPGADDLAAIVYTSGTTGRPKGVMLTHANVLSNVRAALARVAPREDDVFLSFLPLSHTFERTAGYYLAMAAGCCVAYARSVAKLSEDLRTVRPTILISVPRIYERAYSALQATLATSMPKARFFAWGAAIGWRRFCRRQRLPVEGRMPRLLDELAWLVIEPLVARPLRERFGGRLRVAVSGGAALAQPIARCFLGLGLPLLQGYGMTETSPVVAVNTLDDNDPATVGRPLPQVQLKIGDSSELMVRGPGVMKGYWQREADTRRVLADGWLHTGDQAAIESGRVRILGRLKEIIVTSTGEKIAPADVEIAIGADPLFDQVYVFGDDQPFIGCIVVLQRAAWSRLAASLHLDEAAASSLESTPALAAVLERVRMCTLAFPYYAQPRAVILTLEPWTVENALITPTLKLKRNNLAAHFSLQITAMYRRRAMRP